MMGPADRDDEIAAAIILQGYLDSARLTASQNAHQTPTSEPTDR
jgi:hypothetical protein